MIGYAAGDDHLYLVYEYVQNGSLNDHLHDPFLKGMRQKDTDGVVSSLSSAPASK